MHFFKNLIIFSIIYLVFLTILFAVSANGSKYLLIGYILISIEFIIFLILYYIQNLSLTKKIAKLLSFSFITYIIHLLIVLPLSLMFISNDLGFAIFQKSILTVIRVLIILQLYLIIIFFIVKIFKKNKLKIQKIFLFFILSILISFLIPVQFIQVKFVYFLNSFLPMFLIFFILVHILIFKNNFNIYDKFKKYLNPTLTIVIGFLVLAYIFGLSLYLNKWELFDVGTLYALKGYEPIDGLPRSWWIEIGNSPFFRFPITLENPITAGYLSAFITMILLYSARYKFSIIFFLFTIFSFSKGAILYLILYTIGMIFSRISHNLKILFLRIFNSFTMITILLIIYISLQIVLSSIFKSSASIHILGLTLPFIHIADYSFIEILFGHGIGSGGNTLKGMIGANMPIMEWLGSGSESGMGTLFYQLGLLGFVSVLIINYKIIFLLRTVETKFIYFFYFLNMFMQENLINLNLLLLVFFTIIVIEFQKQPKGLTCLP